MEPHEFKCLDWVVHDEFVFSGEERRSGFLSVPEPARYFILGEGEGER